MEIESALYFVYGVTDNIFYAVHDVAKLSFNSVQLPAGQSIDRIKSSRPILLDAFDRCRRYALFTELYSF
jgi:hypothetical protein